MNALTPITMDFRPAYEQLAQVERRFVDGYVTDLEDIASKTGQRLTVVLLQPYPYTLDARALALLASALVRSAICERVKTLSDLVDLSPYRTLRELCAIAYSNIGNYVKIDQHGVPMWDFTKVTNEQMAAVKTFKIEEKPRGGVKSELVLHDKLAALVKAMEYQGLTKPDNPHWANQERQEAGAKEATLPVGIDQETAAKLYGDMINQ